MHHGTWHLDVQREIRGGVLEVAIAGRAGHASRAALREALQPSGATVMVVDLSGLDYMSGTGLEALETAAADADRGGCLFVLCGLRGAVRNAFELAGVLTRFRVETDRQQARERVLGR